MRVAKRWEVLAENSLEVERLEARDAGPRRCILASPPSPREAARMQSLEQQRPLPLDGSGLKALVARVRADMQTRLVPGGGGLEVGRQHASMLDAILSALFFDARKKLSKSFACALAAVGSYGRGAVALRSDADVRLIVTSSRHQEHAGKLLEAIMYPLWDAGVSLGHQVVEPDEALDLAAHDLATATALLDLRFVAGDVAVVKELVDRAHAGLFGEGNLAAFVRQLEEEAEGRHARFGGSLYLLEPDVKAGAGALRDLDGARWAARARFRVGDATRAPAVANASTTWSELVQMGVLVAREAGELERAEELMWRIRNRLHAHAGRRSDRLTFDEQEGIAAELGYAGDRAQAAEQLMQDYYLHARAVTRGRERILLRATPPRRRGRPVESDLGRGVRLFDGHVTFAADALEADPALAMRAYAACVRHGAPILPFAREAVGRAAADPAWCERLRASREAADLFVELVCTVPEARAKGGSMARELHDVGLLLAMIPEFLPVTGRVHHDVYHVYTVDVHSVAAIDCMRALARGDLAHERPLASRLAAEVARPRELFMATLLHDVGKGYPDATGSRKNHSVSGATLCDTILPRLGFSADEVEEAKALVLQHLAMYHTATRRDLDDAATTSEFCKLVRGREGLRDLYLLTVADITTTSPTAMTSWKARMLDELYFAADAFLAGAKDHAIDDARLDAVRAGARSRWTGPTPALDDFVTTMPDRYLLANDAEAVVAHARVALERGDKTVHAAVVPSRHPECVEICVVAADSPGLLSRIAAALTSARLEVLAAQIYSRARSAGGVEAVDLFWVRDKADAPDAVARAMPRLARDLDEVCSARVSPEALLRERVGGASPWRERPSPAIQPEVVVDDRASPRHTVVEVFAKDRPGLLYTLAHALHELGLSIALSKINTEGTKVADVFYVNELDGSKVSGADRVRAIREALLAALGE
jgi:[protein-PII] uridylyltransferase